jgi:hypothetical protein
MSSMSWMIAELANTISSLGDRNVEKFTYQRTLFPAPATKGKNPSVSAEAYEWATTHVFHRSKEENSAQTISISSTFRRPETTPRSRGAAICCVRPGFSLDRVERANFECLLPTCHLPHNLSVSFSNGEWEMTDVSTCLCHSRFAVTFLALSQTQNYLHNFQQIETYCAFPLHLEGGVFNSQ